jgi:hypothetical protein
MTTTETTQWLDHSSRHIRPAERASDPAALAQATSAAEQAAAEHEAASQALDVADGIARRNPIGADKAALHLLVMAEEGARQRRDLTRRLREELAVVEIIHEADEQLGRLSDAAYAAERAARTALDTFAAALLDLRHEQARIMYALHEATPDLGMRLRLTGLSDRYAALPLSSPPAVDRLARLVEPTRLQLDAR